MLVLCLVILFAGGCAITGENAGPGGTCVNPAGDIYNGNTAYLKGCYTNAVSYYMAAYEVSVASADTPGQALALNNLANAYSALGKTD